MLRGDVSGRVPFALVAVFLLLSAGVSALFAARLARDEADARAHEAQLAALNAVADGVHEEVVAQAQYIALDAISKGTDGLLNETKVAVAFRGGFADYLASRFPRVVRGVAVSVASHAGDIGFVERRVEDQLPSSATRVEVVEGFPIETPDLAAPDVIAPVDRLAYFDVHGFVNYTLKLDAVTLQRPAPLYTAVPVPAPLMAAKLEQATRSGEGELMGVGRTVKAILATLVQFRVLDGMASQASPNTTTRDVLSRDDVELAVNLALLLEEIRVFRTYDRDAAKSIDAASARPSIPDGILPSAQERTLVRLLDRYAANGTLDATDLYALYTGLDARGVSLASLLAQTIAAIADELALKAVDYLGLTPLADFLNAAVQTVGNWVDGFWNWATGNPSARAQYVRKFIGTVFVDTGIGTGFFGPLDFPLPARSYAIPDGNGSILISIASHVANVTFPTLDLFSSGFDDVWDKYCDEFKTRVGAVDASLRSLANDIAAQIGRDAELSGLLPKSAAGVINPKDNVSFLDALGARVDVAIDSALDRLRTDPYAVETLMGNLWDATKALLDQLVGFLISSYDAWTGLVMTVSGFDPARALEGDLAFRASLDPDYVSLDATQRSKLGDAIAADVSQNRWANAAKDARKSEDIARWRHALDLADGTTRPGAHLRAQIQEQVLGASGWLLVAGQAVKQLVSEAVQGQDLAATRSVYRTSAEPFTLRDPWTADRPASERFRVRQSPGYLRLTPGLPVGPIDGELRAWIIDPADVPASDETPNVHYTNPFAPSRRPFTTQWSVVVKGAIRLRVETAAAVLLGPRGLEPAGVEKTWPIEFAFSVAAYSGWNLAGVQYHASDTVLSSLVKFLDAVSGKLLTLLRWVLDVFRKGLEILREFVARMFDFVHRVVRLLSDLFTRLVGILRLLATKALSLMGTLLDAASGLPTLPGGVGTSLHLGGIGFTVLANGGEGRRLVIGFDLQGHGEITFLRIAESRWAGRAQGAPEYDVLGTWDSTIGSLHASASFDPISLVQTHMVEGMAEWRGAWHADFAGPELESALVVGPSVGFTIILPPGAEVGVRAGIEMLVSTAPAFDLAAAAQRVIKAAISEAGTLRSWRDVGRVARAIAQHVETEVLDLVEDTIIELAVYLEITVSGAGAGGGVRLSLVAEGRSIRLLLEWIIDNIAAYFERGVNPFAVAEFLPPPVGILEHTWVRVEAFFSMATPDILAGFGLEAEIRAGARIQPNLSAIGRLVGREAGRAEVRFGVLADAEAKTGWMGMYHALYLLRGSVVFP